MELDGFRDALREALRNEAVKIAVRGDKKSKIDLIALLEGAKCQLAERDAAGRATDPAACGFPNAARHKYFRLGWDIAARIG